MQDDKLENVVLIGFLVDQARARRALRLGRSGPRTNTVAKDLSLWTAERCIGMRTAAIEYAGADVLRHDL